MAEENFWGESNFYKDNSFWDDTPELNEEDVIIKNDEQESPEEIPDETDDQFFNELMNSEPEDEVVQQAKSNPTLSGWVPNEAPKKTSVSNNAKFAYDYYTQKGLPAHVAAGIVGNLMKESNVNPNTKDGDRRGGIGGIAQWDPTRSDSLRRFAGAQGRSVKDLNTQLDFVLHEAQQRGDLDRVKQAKTPEEAAVIFGRSYEKPNEKYADWGTRQSNARSLTKGQSGVVENIPEIEYLDPEDLELGPPEYTPNSGGESTIDTNPEQPIGDAGQKALNVVNQVNSGITKFQQFKSKVGQIGANAAKTVSEAIDFQNEISGSQRNAQSARKFEQRKNNQKFSPIRTILNQPSIYS